MYLAWDTDSQNPFGPKCMGDGINIQQNDLLFYHQLECFIRTITKSTGINRRLLLFCTDYTYKSYSISYYFTVRPAGTAHQFTNIDRKIEAQYEAFHSDLLLREST